MILSAKIILIVAWLSLYIFDGGPMEWPIDLSKFLIQFLYNTPVYISLVSALELPLDVSGCFLAHQTMMIPLKR